MSECVKIHFPNLDKFYTETDIVEETGNKPQWDECNQRDERWWVGLSLEDIKKHKYSYKDGLDSLREIELSLDLGSSRKQYRWSETDGDDMSMERMYESKPFMQQRIKTAGIGNGKFVTLHVNIGENCGTGAHQMLHKAYTAIRVVDLIENLGYRVRVIAYTNVSNVGYYKDEKVHRLVTEIVIKDFHEPLNKPLIMTCVSPWMFRYHVFKIWCAKFKTTYGLGQSGEFYEEQNRENIYIRNGECLNERGAELKIEEFKEMFGIDNEK